MIATVRLHSDRMVEAVLTPGWLGRLFGFKERTIYLVAKYDELGWIHWFDTSGTIYSEGHPAVRAIAEKPWAFRKTER